MYSLKYIKIISVKVSLVKEKNILKATAGVSLQKVFRVKTVNSLHSAWIPYLTNFISIWDHCIEVEDKNIQGQ